MKWVRETSCNLELESKNMEIYGHRGAAGVVLENTVASIKKAIELKVDRIEFDVRATKDSQPVVIHDDTLERLSLIHI